MDALQSNFQLFDFSRLTLYHYIIWISIGVLGFYVSYSIEKIEKLRVSVKKFNNTSMLGDGYC